MTGFFKIIVDFLGLMLTRIQALSVLHFMAFKAILITLFITVLPILLNNFLYDLIEIIVDLVGDVTVSGISSQSFTGLAGWFLIKCKIVDAFSIVMSCAVVRYTISLVSLGRL